VCKIRFVALLGAPAIGEKIFHQQTFLHHDAGKVAQTHNGKRPASEQGPLLAKKIRTDVHGHLIAFPAG